MLARSFLFGEMIKGIAKSAGQVLHLSNWKAVFSSVPPDGNFRKILIISRCLHFGFFLVLPVYCYQPVTLHPHAHMLSHVTPWTAASQAPLSTDFSRQEYWSGLPFPSPKNSAFKTRIAQIAIHLLISIILPKSTMTSI